jgi:lipoprotein-anchoring transpeptidase ErfK/SrfK
MKHVFIKRTNTLWIAAIFIAAISSFNCGVPVTNTNVQTNVNTASPQPVASPSPAAEKATTTLFTLPMLDALLSDQEFLAEAKRKVSLTDEEVDRLRDIAGKSIGELSEDGGEDNRSARAANEQAVSKIRAILGEDRTNQLIALASNRSGDSDTTLAAKPNSIPTDTRVVVNSPAYRMDVFKDGKLLKTYKIGIGYPEFPLPTGMRKASSIIFNPTWTPPDEPWVKGKVKAGEKVEAGDKLNPLGPIKIPIGLPSLIHGGKSAARLGTFASHGCVGLTNGQVQDFAMLLSSLGGQQITMADIKGYEKTKTETKEVKLGQSVPVELRYETIVVENGTLKIFRDVYEQGTNTEENLRKVLEVYGVSLDSLQPAIKEKIMDALKQQATDAQGKPADPLSSVAGNGNSGSNSSAKSNTNSNANSGNVTRTIKGKKEIAIPIPELAGKGYPAPVAMLMQ